MANNAAVCVVLCAASCRVTRIKTFFSCCAHGVVVKESEL
jgi:hypothetical protein